MRTACFFVCFVSRNDGVGIGLAFVDAVRLLSFRPGCDSLFFDLRFRLFPTPGMDGVQDL
jgi:hypothetical protein